MAFAGTLKAHALIVVNPFAAWKGFVVTADRLYLYSPVLCITNALSEIPGQAVTNRIPA